MVGDFRRLLTTPCPDCVIDVVAWRGAEAGPGSSTDGWVNVGLLSHHTFAHFNSWRGKIQRIGHVLKGESYPWLEFFDRDTAEKFAVALKEATDVAFPSITSE